ncbi:MAG: hypothetical protein DRI48_00940 [Chloroflexi bacterium]|nr:MAG: hypothetical protein DRI48_00940 [Chloroflexota bacterium]
MSQTFAERQSSQIIGDLVSRIVDAVHPLRIILFGSAARGEMGPESDIDVLVVVPDGTHRLKTVRYLYKRMFGFGHPVDIVVTTPSIFERHKDNIGLIYRTTAHDMVSSQKTGGKYNLDAPSPRLGGECAGQISSEPSPGTGTSSKGA